MTNAASRERFLARPPIDPARLPARRYYGRDPENEEQAIEVVVCDLIRLSHRDVDYPRVWAWKDARDGQLWVRIRPEGYVVHYNGRDGAYDEETYPTPAAIVLALVRGHLSEWDPDPPTVHLAKLRPDWFDGRDG
jgi:hypothetical protein